MGKAKVEVSAEDLALGEAGVVCGGGEDTCWQRLMCTAAEAEVQSECRQSCETVEVRVGERLCEQCIVWRLLQRQPNSYVSNCVMAGFS